MSIFGLFFGFGFSVRKVEYDGIRSRVFYFIVLSQSVREPA